MSFARDRRVLRMVTGENLSHQKAIREVPLHVSDTAARLIASECHVDTRGRGAELKGEPRETYKSTDEMPDQHGNSPQNCSLLLILSPGLCFEASGASSEESEWLIVPDLMLSQPDQETCVNSPQEGKSCSFESFKLLGLSASHLNVLTGPSRYKSLMHP